MQALDLGGSKVRQFLCDLERPRKCLTFGSLRPKLLDCPSRTGGSPDQVEIDFAVAGAYRAIAQETNELPDGRNRLVLLQRDRRKAVDLHSDAPQRKCGGQPLIPA